MSDWNDAQTFGQIFEDLDTANQVISDTVLLFTNLVESRIESGSTPEEILEEINDCWYLTENKFESLEEAEDWFNDLGI